MLGSSIRRAFAATALLMLGLVPASAAKIEVSTRTIDGEEVAFIAVNGELELGDERRFADIAIGNETAIVMFHSPGGNLFAGIEIGTAIHLKGFVTLVASGDECASACALAWLGGRARFMGADARIGFHAASERAGRESVTSGAGNAITGAYLQRLGLPLAAIAYVAEASPDDMRWLTFKDAEEVGIAVQLFDPPETGSASAPSPAPSSRPPARQAPPASPAAPPSEWTYGDGEWIQLFSREDASAAIGLAAPYHLALRNAAVFRYDNGWYVVVIGPYATGTARAELNRMRAGGAIPDDSLVSSGERFAALVWDGSARPARTVAPAAPDGAATRVAETATRDLIAAYSQPKAHALRALAALYAPQLSYFGEMRSKDEVLADKTEFFDRWPMRLYTIRPGSLSTRCDRDGRCEVSAIVEWRTESYSRDSRAAGTARFDLVFEPRGGALAIVSETSEVISRGIAGN